MGLGRQADRVAGTLSRLLHLRGAQHNTLAALREEYLGVPLEVLFPAPPSPRDLVIERRLADRVLGTRAATLRWPSDHQPLSRAYLERHRRDYASNLTAHARWVRPAGPRRSRLLVYVHGWLEPGPWAEEATLFRRWSRELPVDLLHVALPFHGPRTPRGSLFSGEYFWTADLVRSLEGVRQGIWDTRSAFAWAREQGYEEVGVTGLSLGGALCMLLACLEPLPDYVVPMMAHLQLHHAIEHAPILWRMKRDLERFGVTAAERRALFQELGWDRLPPKLAPERQLWIQAREDLYIDPALVEQQWRAWGQPPILWIEGGHMTFPLQVPALTERIRRFLMELERPGTGVGAPA